MNLQKFDAFYYLSKKINMKTSLLVFLALCTFSVFGFNSTKMNTQSLSQNKALVSEKDSILRHVVLFKFKEGTTDSQLNSIEESFGSLPSKIPEIVDYEWGLNNSPEGLNKDFTHCFFVSFESEEGRATYLPHPAHKEFVELVGPFVDDVLVVDYWIK